MFGITNETFENFENLKIRKVQNCVHETSFEQHLKKSIWFNQILFDIFN